MSTTNQHGLTRTIPSDIKLQVRQKCGFGCVICGSWIYEYEHFNPEFKDATSHEPDGIALLCCTHHGAKTKGLITNEQVSTYRANPYNIENGINNNELFFASNPTIFLCGNEMIDGGSIIANLKFTSPFQETCMKTNTTKMTQELVIPIIHIGNAKPEEPIPVYISFFDSIENFNPIFKIENNEWYGNIDNFDIETTGTNLTIRKKKGKVLLNIDFNTAENKIEINNIDVTMPGVKINRFLYTEDTYGIKLNDLKIINSTIVGKLTINSTLRNTPGQFEIIRE